MSIIGMTADRNNSKSFDKILKAKFKTKKAIRESWFALGRDLENSARRAMAAKNKTGRVYFSRTEGGKGRRHRASAGGETHATRVNSHKLMNSTSWKVHGTERMDFGYGLATSANNRAPKYDKWVEDGHKARDKSKVGPRPSIENAVKAVNGKEKRHFESAMLAEFRRV